MAATRLDRLVSLLDTGSTPAIRATAAKQLGQIAAVRIRGQSTAQQAAAHARPHKTEAKSSAYTAGSGTSTPAIDPEADGLIKSEDAASTSTKQAGKFGTSEQINKQHNFSGPSVDDNIGIYRGTDGDWDEITSYLARVVPFLRSKSWDTRVAAALLSRASVMLLVSGTLTSSRPSQARSSKSVLEEDETKDAKPDLSNSWLPKHCSLLTLSRFQRCSPQAPSFFHRQARNSNRHRWLLVRIVSPRQRKTSSANWVLVLASMRWTLAWM